MTDPTEPRPLEDTFNQLAVMLELNEYTEREAVDELLTKLKHRDDIDPEQAAALLPNQEPRRLYRDYPDDADDILEQLGLLRSRFSIDGLQQILDALLQHTGESPDFLNDAEDIETALYSRRKVKEHNEFASQQGGRPSKVEQMMQQLRQDHDFSPAQRDLALALADFKDEVSRPTWYKLRDQADEELDVDVDELAEEGTRIKSGVS